MRVLGIIPARGGSKGVPRKNVRVVAGKPLIAYTIEAAKGSQLLMRSVVSTDDPEISRIARSLDCEVIKRPAELAEDATSMPPVIGHVLGFLDQYEKYHPEITVILQPTAPMRTSQHIDEAIRLLEDSGADSLVSVSPVPGHFNPHWQFIIEKGELHQIMGKPLSQIISRRQDLPQTYTRNGAIYAFRTAILLAQGDIYGDHCIPYVMCEEDSVNIDAEIDLWSAERLLQKKGA